MSEYKDGHGDRYLAAGQPTTPCDHPTSARVRDSGGWSCSRCESFIEDDDPGNPPLDKTARIAALLAADPEAFDWITAEGYGIGYGAGFSAGLGVERPPDRTQLEWFGWFVRKTKGTIAEVTARALDQNPYLRALADPS